MTAAAAYPAAQANALEGKVLPNVSLASTDGANVVLSELVGRIVIYAYPRTSPPNGPVVPGWSDIPGAKGCTPQSCGFRDHYSELQSAGASHVFGLSTQTTKYQQEVVERLHLPFALLSDSELLLQSVLGLPLLETSGMTLLHRITLVIQDAKIERVFHNITQPEINAAAVLDYLAGTITNRAFPPE